MRKCILFAALLGSFLAPLMANPPVPTLHAEARVVQIDVVVTDSHGKPVTDLTKDDFTLIDQGKPRKIDIFAVEAPGRGGVNREQSPAATRPAAQSLPPNVFSNRNPGPPERTGHSTVLVLDQVNAYLEDAAYAREQVISLIKRVPADERIALYTIARKQGLVLLQDYTTDRELLLQSLKKYAPHGLTPSPPPPHTVAKKSGDTSTGSAAMAQAVAWGKGSDQPSPPGLPNTEPPSGILDKLAMWQENTASARLSLQALSEHLALVPGRKSVFWITQGFPNWLLKQVGMWTPPAMETDAWNKTITALNEADVAVNTVDSRGVFRGGNPNTGTLDTLQEIAVRTGGKAYIRRNDLDAAMEEGIKASRTTYTLGFYLTVADRDEKFHALTVKAGRPGLQLFYRQGYYAGDTEMPGSSPESDLLNQADSRGVGITARIDSIAPGSPRGTIDLHVGLDPGTLSLSEQASGWAGHVEETFVELNESGNTLARISDKKEFEIPGANRARFDREGVAWQMSLPLAEGTSKILIVARDAKTGKTGSLTVPLK